MFRAVVEEAAALASLALFLGMIAIWLEYRAIFGRTPGIMLLVMFGGLKMLESRSQRDAVALVFLTWFLAITNFLYTQSIPTALGMLAAVYATGILPGRAIAVNPAGVNFAPQPLLSTSAAQTITLSNLSGTLAAIGQLSGCIAIWPVWNFAQAWSLVSWITGCFTSGSASSSDWSAVR